MAATKSPRSLLRVLPRGKAADPGAAIRAQYGLAPLPVAGSSSRENKPISRAKLEEDELEEGEIRETGGDGAGRKSDPRAKMHEVQGCTMMACIDDCVCFLRVPT